ncbi:four helix bundle protein [Clostridium beijerinckii]|nr:four helix bundle protein [Clostridium beijerinckii]
MYNNIIVYKSFNLALEIISIYKYLISKREYVLSKQILRSGTSVGANVKEAVKGYSKNDFLYKMNIALKEANETEYWLELLIQSEILSDYDIKVVLQHCKEICRILNSIVATGMKKG